MAHWIGIWQKQTLKKKLIREIEFILIIVGTDYRPISHFSLQKGNRPVIKIKENNVPSIGTTHGIARTNSYFNPFSLRHKEKRITFPFPPISTFFTIFKNTPILRLANTIELELKMFPHERKLQQIQQQRLMVEQLRREANINRISVSQVMMTLNNFGSN